MKESTKSVLLGAAISAVGAGILAFLNRTRLGDHVHLGDVVTDKALGTNNPILVTQVDVQTTSQDGQYSGHQINWQGLQTETFSKADVTSIMRSGVPVKL